MTLDDAFAPGVLDLAIALRKLQQDFGLRSFAGTIEATDGHDLTLAWSGDQLTLERDDGWMLVLDGTAAMS